MTPRPTIRPTSTSAIPLTPQLRSPAPPAFVSTPAQPASPSAAASPSSAELAKFGLSLAHPSLPFTAYLMPSPPPSPCRVTTFSNQGGTEAGSSTLAKSAAAPGASARRLGTGPPQAALPAPPPLVALPCSPPPSPPLRNPKRLSRSADVAALSASLARSWSQDSAASSLAEDDFERELSELTLRLPMPPHRHSLTLPPSPPHTESSASSLRSHSKARCRLSTASAASAASAASTGSPCQFHLPRLHDGSPRVGGGVKDADGAPRPASFDPATLVAARSRKDGAVVDKRWSEGSPRVGFEVTEASRQQRLSALDFGDF